MKKLLFSLGLVFALLFVVALSLNSVVNKSIQAQTPTIETGYIWVDTERDGVHGNGWMDGANLTLNFGEEEFNFAASQNGTFVVEFGPNKNIPVGELVTVTHATESVTHTPKHFTLGFPQEQYSSDFQTTTNPTITGTAPDNAYVILWLSSLGPHGDRGFTRYFYEAAEVQADEHGDWEYTFQNVNERPFEYRDIHAFLFYEEDDSTQIRLADFVDGQFTMEEGPGNTLYIEDHDDELYQLDWYNTNATFLTRYSDPGAFTIGVNYQTNTISGGVFPFGDLEITIQRGNETFTYEHGLLVEGAFSLHYDDHFYNVKPGDIVTASVGEVSITHEVIDLRITNIDSENDRVYGTTNYIDAEGDDYVFVSLTNRYAQQGIPRVVSPNPDGTWVADFSVAQVCPISGQTWGVLEVTPDTNAWIYQDVEVEPIHHEISYGRTTVASPLALIELVRSFLITRMAEFASITTNISAVLDDPSQKLIFESAGFGRIEFSSFDIETLLVINPEYFENLEDMVKISYNSDTNTLSSKVATSTLDFLAGHNATIQFFKVAERLGVTGITAENIQEHIDIEVYDEDNLVTDISDYFDWDNVEYDPETDTITLPVNHFTEYVLGASSELSETDDELPETGAAIIGAVSIGILSLGGYALYKRKKKN